ncbi:MAG: glycoside-pentoside-hexuronide (GPH):cation symporter [Lactobacillaceae bacterium]|jgi:GPH family glycoside/pentoside/hexuronide:cation symporter|nr:glycoside-pentoside-hexuronide (GPH):cation symporter [Lactobacillaceae bacterium]
MEKNQNNSFHGTENGFVKLSWLERIGFGAGSMAGNLIFQTVGSQLLFYLTTVYGLKATLGAWVFTFVRFFNVFWDPIVGVFIDKHQFKWGKYRPYLLYAGVPLLVFGSLLFFPLESLRGSFWFAFLSYLVLAGVYSFFDISYNSLNSSLTLDPEEIQKTTTIRMMIGNIGGLFVYTILPLMVQAGSPDRKLKDTGMGFKMMLGDWTAPGAANAWFTTMISFMILGFLLMLFTFFTAKERVLPDASEAASVKYSDLFAEFKRNKPLQILGLFFLAAFTLMLLGNTANNYFMTYSMGRPEWAGILGLIGNMPGIFLMPLAPLMHKKLGKKVIFYLTLLLYVIGVLVMFGFEHFNFMQTFSVALLGSFLRSTGVGLATGYMWALVPEVVNYGEVKAKKRVAGIINAIMGLMFKIGLAIGGVVPSFLLGAAHFNSAAKNPATPAVLNVIDISFVWLPIVLAIISMFIMSRYPLSDNDVQEINAELETRRETK